MKRHWLLLGLATCCWTSPVTAAGPKTKNVFVVTMDGFRWQEVFTGADESFMDKEMGGVKDPLPLKQRFVRPTAEERRQILMPFFWKTIATQGQVFGDPSRRAAARLTNGMKFSYPGYNELFCGFGDPAIDSNSKKPNANLSVLEYLNGRPGFENRVAAACSWDVFPFILRSMRNGLSVQSGWDPIRDPPLTERQKAINDFAAELPRYWPDNTFDVVTMTTAREHLQRHRPRVFFIGLGETDEWGHSRRYDLYLGAAQNSDRFLAEIWDWCQKTPEYAGSTSLIVTTDHGRGSTRMDWIDHNKDVPGAELLWIGVLGPDTPALGVREGINVTQGQVAATIAQLLGEDFNAASPKAAPPLPGIR